MTINRKCELFVPLLFCDVSFHVVREETENKMHRSVYKEVKYKTEF